MITSLARSRVFGDDRFVIVCGERTSFHETLVPSELQPTGRQELQDQTGSPASRSQTVFGNASVCETPFHGGRKAAAPDSSSGSLVGQKLGRRHGQRTHHHRIA